MIIIPAIDIRGGKVVRLAQGKFSDETVYSDSPLEMAKRWDACGAEMIHIVDLDGAAEGMPKNLDTVRMIASAVKARIELGGGIRSEASIGKAIEAGVSKVVIGTKALDEAFLKAIVRRFGDSIVVGVDASRGMVCTKGWVCRTEATVEGLVKKVESFGVKTINYTDISKDGMLEGPNVGSLRELLGITKMDVVLAGGVSSVRDIEKLKQLEGNGLKGVIIGKALYENRIDLKEAIAAGKQ